MGDIMLRAPSAFSRAMRHAAAEIDDEGRRRSLREAALLSADFPAARHRHLLPPISSRRKTRWPPGFTSRAERYISGRLRSLR